MRCKKQAPGRGKDIATRPEAVAAYARHRDTELIQRATKSWWANVLRADVGWNAEESGELREFTPGTMRRATCNSPASESPTTTLPAGETGIATKFKVYGRERMRRAGDDSAMPQPAADSNAKQLAAQPGANRMVTSSSWLGYQMEESSRPGHKRSNRTVKLADFTAIDDDGTVQNRKKKGAG